LSLVASLSAFLGALRDIALRGTLNLFIGLLGGGGSGLDTYARWSESIGPHVT
jgi:hypothetical protein